MDASLLASWAARSVEERVASLEVCDPELVSVIDANMRMLWTAEIQARQYGVKSVNPFDQTKLPLLSTMQFDGSTEDGKVSQKVRWPQEMSADPMMIVAALRSSSSSGSPEELLPRRKWRQIFHTPAASWGDFEQQMAKLVEQLVLHPPGILGGGGDGIGDAPDDEEADGEDGDGAPVLRARAAKRARQRERRKMGKALARGQGPEDGDTDPLAIAAGAAAGSQGDVPALGSLPGTMAHSVTGGSVGEAPASEAPPEGAATPKEEAKAALKAGVQAAISAGQAAEEVQGRAPSKGKPEKAAEAATPAAAGHTSPGGSRPTSSASSPRFVATSAAAAPAAAVAPAAKVAAPKVAKAAALKGLAGSNKSGSEVPRGGGRGRPIGGGFPGMGLPRSGMGVGRGKALAPPPGLQAMNLGASQRSPGTLSRPWMPGPPIPEEEFGHSFEAYDDMDYMDDDDYDLAMEQLNGWIPPPLELPLGSLDPGMQTPSMWSKAVTPTEDWGMTPSCASEPQSPALRHMYDPASAGLFSMALGAGHMTLASGEAAYIPMYVTVPLAETNLCPHCGKHFAPPPDLQGPAPPEEMVPAVPTNAAKALEAETTASLLGAELGRLKRLLDGGGDLTVLGAELDRLRAMIP